MIATASKTQRTAVRLLPARNVPLPEIVPSFDLARRPCGRAFESVFARLTLSSCLVVFSLRVDAGSL